MSFLSRLGHSNLLYTAAFAGALTLLFTYAGCSSAPTTNKGPARPWQRYATKGFYQNSVDAFGVKFIVRAWPSQKPLVPPAQAAAMATAEIERIAKIADAGVADSELSKINDGAYQSPVPISQELYSIFTECQRMYQLSGGKFDVTFVPIKYDLSDGFNTEDLNVMTDWDHRPPISGKTAHLFGQQNMLLDPEPPRARLYNRRTKINLNGMARGYAAQKAAAILAKQGMAGYAVMAEGFAAVGGTALADPALMCIENPVKLGTCLYRINPTLAPTANYLMIGSSASQERRGKIFDPKDTWIYRSGGVVVVGQDGAWVQFGTTITAVMDDGQLTTFFQKTQSPRIAGAFFNRDNNQILEGTLAPFGKAQKLGGAPTASSAPPQR